LRVVILSNRDEQCGNFTYARNLLNALKHWYDVEILDNALWTANHGNPDVVIINWHPARVSTSTEHVRFLQHTHGAKVILLHQNSHDSTVHIGDDDILLASDAVVAHEPLKVVTAGEKKPNLYFIPHGILECRDLHRWDGSVVPIIGTAGFQFDWKRPDVTVEAARYLKVQARIFCPPYPGFDRNRAIDRWTTRYNALHVDRNFLLEEQVIRCLSEHLLNIFWFQSQSIHDQYGQSGAVRMGIAARRPVILSRHRKFLTLFPYEDELYFADTEEQVYKYAEEILANPSVARVPNRIFSDMGWSKTGQMYKEVIESLV